MSTALESLLKDIDKVKLIEKILEQSKDTIQQLNQKNQNSYQSESCTVLNPNRMIGEWVSIRKLAQDSVALATYAASRNYAGIIGIPRSGLMPASIISTITNIPLFVFDRRDNQLRELNNFNYRGLFLHRSNYGKLLVVDDTVGSGGTISRLKPLLHSKGIQADYCAIYSSTPGTRFIDFCYQILDAVHFLEWNLANSPIVDGTISRGLVNCGIMFDLDGIIIVDEPFTRKHNIPYGRFPYIAPRGKHAIEICTGRRECERKVTEDMLRQLEIKYSKLYMLPDKYSPLDIKAIIDHKVKHFVQSCCKVFIESDPVQAEEIFRMSQKIVICPIIEKVFWP